jgi:hypothetical protein
VLERVKDMVWKVVFGGFGLATIHDVETRSMKILTKMSATGIIGAINSWSELQLRELSWELIQLQF